MNKVKHTPGPWVIDHETRPAEVCCVYGTSHPNSFVYVRGAVGYWTADGDENMANAILIAAAPDLLAALRRVTEQLVHQNPNDEAWVEARAAITKATGGAK